MCRCYRNDEGGALAYDPAILLKIILFAYSRGITSSRAIARACEENVVFMALSADSRPHFTTIAAFIASMGEGAAQLCHRWMRRSSGGFFYSLVRPRKSSP